MYSVSCREFLNATPRRALESIPPKTPMRITARDLDALNQRLDTFTPEALLAWTAGTFGRRAALLSSMQRAGTTLCHLADRAGHAFDVLFVDTGVLHAETLATRDVLARTHRHLAVVTLHPARTFAAQCAAEGVLYLTKEGQERCCELRKSEPLRTAKGRYDALVSALRRGEGGARGRIRPVELDAEMNALRVHPFVHADDAWLARYAAEHDGVVLNPLHAMGFPTVGCFPCTTPVRADEAERAGRWRHLADVTYCGINPTDRAAREEPSVELDDRYHDALLRP